MTKINVEKTVTKQQALASIERAVIMCELSGISAKVSPLYDNGHKRTVVVLIDVDLIQGHLVVAEPEPSKDT